MSTVISTPTPPLNDFSQQTPHRTPTPVNRRLSFADLCTVFCSNETVRASPPGVSKRSGTGQAAFREIPPLRVLLKKGGGIYFFLFLYTALAFDAGVKKPPEGG